MGKGLCKHTTPLAILTLTDLLAFQKLESQAGDGSGVKTACSSCMDLIPTALEGSSH